MADKTDGVDFLAGLLVGALVGAAAALLFAPQSGEETRAMIREKGIELQERADEVSLEARRRAAELQAQARERTEQLSVQTKEKAAAVQAKVKQAVDEGKTVATHKKEDLLTTLDEQAGEDALPAEA